MTGVERPARSQEPLDAGPAGPAGSTGPVGPAGPADWTALACILLIALGVRLVWMTDALSYDEAQHFLVARSPLFEDFVREFRLRGHPPLAYLLMKPFVALGASVLWVRMAALSCGLASVVVVYFLLTRTLRAPRAALVGTLLIALAPLFVKQSIEARHYSLCLLLVWACLWLWQRMRANDFERASEHLALAALQLLALLAEYSAVFAVCALSLVIYAPLLVRAFRRADWRRIAQWGIPQVFVAALAGALFGWQFEGAVPSYSHTEAAVYLAPGAGSGDFRSLFDLFDLASLGAFLWRQLGFFQNAILPAPFGLGVLLALLLAFAPWLSDDPRARACRSVAVYALLSLGLTIAASLLGLFPFGGRPRHNAALVPGIVLAAYLSTALSVAAISRPGARRAVGGALLALVALALALGLRPGLQGREGFDRHSQRLGVARFRESPGSVVANWRGRIYASWWFLGDTTPRRLGVESQEQSFRYGGVVVTESELPAQIIAVALREARRTGQAWVLLSHFRGEDSEHLRRVFGDLEREIARAGDVAVSYVGEAGRDFFPPLIALQLRTAVPAGSQPVAPADR